MTDLGELAEERLVGAHRIRWHRPRLCFMEFHGDLIDEHAARIVQFHEELCQQTGGILLMCNLDDLARFPASARRIAAEATQVRFLGTALYGGRTAQKMVTILLLNAINLFARRKTENPTQHFPSAAAAWEFLRGRDEALRTQGLPPIG